MSGDLELVRPTEAIPRSVDLRRTGLVERRARSRTQLHWPLELSRDGQKPTTIKSTTQDLSSGGFYCLIRVQLAEGERLRCSLTIPTHDPRKCRPERTLECRVRVVRVVPQEASDLFGVACRIEDYRLQP